MKTKIKYVLGAALISAWTAFLLWLPDSFLDFMASKPLEGKFDMSLGGMVFVGGSIVAIVAVEITQLIRGRGSVFF